MSAYPTTPLFCAAVIAWVTACGGSDLTLPGDGSPSALHAISGNGQEGTVGTELPDPLVAQLLDGAARPVPGVSLEFRFRNDVPGARIEPSTRVTDESGFAAVHVRLGSEAGSQTVDAIVPDESGNELRTTFGLTALEKEEGHGGGGGKKKKGRK